MAWYWTVATVTAAMAMALTTTACAGDRENPFASGEETDGDGDGDGDADGDVSAGTGGQDTTPGTTSPTSSDGGSWDDGPTTTFLDSSGGAEDDEFGMDDDMPLVASIPPIKQGAIELDQYVLLEKVIATSRVAVGGDGIEELFVQEPEGGQFSGIMIRGEIPGDQIEPGTVVDVLGHVRAGAHHRVVVGEVFFQELQDDPPPLYVDVNTLTPFSPTLHAHEGVLVRLEALKVIVGLDGVPRLDGRVLLDDRFAEGLPPLVAGGGLSAVVGVLMITADGIAIGPRSADDLIP